MVLKTVESSLDCKEIQPVHPKGNQSWVFTRRTDVEAETPILWPPDAKSWLIRKDPDAGQEWRWEEKGMTEDEVVGWHHRLDGREFEQAPELVIVREAWRAAVHGVTKSRTRLSSWTELYWIQWWFFFKASAARSERTLRVRRTVNQPSCSPHVVKRLLKSGRRMSTRCRQCGQRRRCPILRLWRRCRNLPRVSLRRNGMKVRI